MKFIVLLLAITGASIWYGYPAYQLHKAEKQIRLDFKTVPSNVVAHQFDRIGKQFARAELLNQYPVSLLYITFPLYEGKEAPEGTMDKIHEVTCEYLNSLKNDSDIIRKATLNVIEQDHMTFKYQVKNKFGDLLLEHQQVVSECPDFAELKLYQPPEESAIREYNPPPMSKAKIAELEAKERKAENGY